MRKVVLIGACLIIAFLLLFGFGFYLTGNAIKEKSKEKVPRHIFYDSPQVESEDYSKTCFPSGEVMEVLLDTKCCEGLQQLTIYDESQTDCSTPLTGVSLCSDCGNALCEYGETECNCPQDCNKPEVRL